MTFFLTLSAKSRYLLELKKKLVLFLGPILLSVFGSRPENTFPCFFEQGESSDDEDDDPITEKTKN